MTILPVTEGPKLLLLSNARHCHDSSQHMPYLSQLSQNSDAVPVPGGSSPGAQWPWFPRSATCALLSGCPPPPGSCGIMTFPFSSLLVFVPWLRVGDASAYSELSTWGYQNSPLLTNLFNSDTLQGPVHVSQSTMGSWSARHLLFRSPAFLGTSRQ